MHTHTRKYVHAIFIRLFPALPVSLCLLFVCVFRPHLDMHHGGQMAVAR
jgi:hypothetical protein